MMTIHAANKERCADYIKTHVKELYHPYFDMIVTSVEEDEGDGNEYTHKFYSFLKSLNPNDDQRENEDFYISHIIKYLKTLFILKEIQ